MAKFDISSNDIWAEGGKALAEGLKGNQVIKELNFSGNLLGYNSNSDTDTSGIIAIADVIPGMGALSSVNLLKNDIGIDQAHILVSILKDHPALKSLCGNKGNEVELDMSDKMNGAADAIMLVPEITDNGAMTSLDVSSNNLGQLAPPQGWRAKDGDGQAPWIHADGREVQRGMPEGSKPEGIIAIANAIPDMGALLLLNLANNSLGELVQPEGWSFGWHGDYSGDKFYKHTDGRKLKTGAPGGSKPEGIIAVANAIPDMGALTKLDISSNFIAVAQGEDLQRICAAGGIELAK
jgi:hypothetical protein